MDRIPAPLNFFFQNGEWRLGEITHRSQASIHQLSLSPDLQFLIKIYQVEFKKNFKMNILDINNLISFILKFLPN